MPKTLLEKVKEKTIIFDGAMGTLIMAAGIESIKSPMLLNLEKPELVTDIHKQYFAAGADVVLTMAPATKTIGRFKFTQEIEH